LDFLQLHLAWVPSGDFVVLLDEEEDEEADAVCAVVMMGLKKLAFVLLALLVLADLLGFEVIIGTGNEAAAATACLLW